jgi:hypothetical protein
MKHIMYGEKGEIHKEYIILDEFVFFFYTEEELSGVLKVWSH